MAPCGRDAGYVKGKEDSQRHVGCALGAASKAATIESAAALHACDIVTVGADVRTHDQEPIHALPQHAEELHASPCWEDGECCMSLRADDVDFAYRKSPIGLVTAGDSSSSVTSSPSLAKTSRTTFCKNTKSTSSKSMAYKANSQFHDQVGPNIYRFA